MRNINLKGNDLAVYLCVLSVNGCLKVRVTKSDLPNRSDKTRMIKWLCSNGNDYMGQYGSDNRYGSDNTGYGSDYTGVIIRD